MPLYDMYYPTATYAQYIPQGMPVQNLPAQGQTQGAAMQGFPLTGAVAPGMPDAAGLQQYIYPANFPDALQLISGAVKGESEDRQFYEYLIEVAPSVEDKEIIKGIRDDEITHFGLFRLIYLQLTGQVLPPPQDTSFSRPPSYCAGLRKALLGEESAVVRYRKILFAMQNRIHINMLTGIITDELRHGTLYSYLYSENGCRT